MAKRKEPQTVQIELSSFYTFLAWYVWQGMEQEAKVLRELALRFVPPVRVDEERLKARVQEYIDHDRKMEDPSNWP